MPATERHTTIENAVIDYTRLGTEDHGIFTAYIGLKGSGWGVAFGGYGFDAYDKQAERRVGHAYGSAWIMEVLRVLEVDTWEKLPGTPVRVETEGFGGRARRIGHYLKDQWFDPEALAATMRPGEPHA